MIPNYQKPSFYKATSVTFEENIEDVEKNQFSPRKKSKAFTQLQSRKSFILDYEEFYDEDFENNLIKSTKRRYSFDEMTSSLAFFNKNLEEERKSTKPLSNIKRNEIKKKKCLLGDAHNENIPQIQKTMSEETTEMIKKTLKSHFLFGNMDMIQMCVLYKIFENLQITYFFFYIVKVLSQRCSLAR